MKAIKIRTELVYEAKGIFNDYLPLRQTLKLESSDALAASLLKMMHNVKFIGVVTIMKHFLPVLNKLSCARFREMMF